MLILLLKLSNMHDTLLSNTMKAYKATYNYKCLNQTYKVGKTYTSDKFKICHYGMHYCNKMEDTLNYYTLNKDFILLEVEILGDVETEKNKSVTNKLKILRVVELDEYPDRMKSRFPTFEYDDQGNMIYRTYPIVGKVTYVYDSSGNMISRTNPIGDKSTYEYDNRGNKIIEKDSDGSKYTFEYDDRGNMINETNPIGDKFTYEYDNRGNKIGVTYANGSKRTMEYDDRGNIISATSPDGLKYTYDVAIITEED